MQRVPAARPGGGGLRLNQSTAQQRVIVVLPGGNLVTALLVLSFGWVAAVAPLALAGAILLAHVGMDRALGYGLKLPTDFRDTHLGRIGR